MSSVRDTVRNSPFRTRGKFDPNVNPNNLPTLSDCFDTQESVLPNDAFILSSDFTYVGIFGPRQIAKAGDRVVFRGPPAGDLTVLTNWVVVQDDLLAQAATRSVEIVSERHNLASK